MLGSNSAHYDRVAFKGDSCFPFSPFKEKNMIQGMTVSKNDQLITIFKSLGPLKENDLSFIKKDNVIQYIDKLQNSCNYTNTSKKTISKATTTALISAPK